MVTTFCVSGAVLAKAGDGVSPLLTGGQVFVSGGEIYAVDSWIDEAESLININSKFDFVTGYSEYDNVTKKILQGIASDFAAINAIAYDMSGYTSREEAKNMITVLRDSALRGLALLRNKETQKFLTDKSTGTV